jgi:acid phosphatase
LTNYWGVTHPSEPNYLAVVVGDEFGMNNDDFHQIPSNVSTVADLLDARGISWGEYQEGLPYAGFQGFNYSNQQTFHNDYVRKHNPLIMENSVTDSDTRPLQIKNFTWFEKDLKDRKLPQWSFITPNMTNDVHDTNITFGGKWALDFLTPLLEDEYFMKDTLVLLTFDESGSYTVGNKVYGVFLGGAVPQELKGTKDDTFYTHYSCISSISANWKLPALGRWDCGANIFKLVADKTGYVNYEVDTTGLYLNHTYPGPLASTSVPDWNIPTTNEKCSGGHDILSQVKRTYGHLKATYDYTSPFPIDTAHNINTGVKFWKPSREGAAHGEGEGNDHH